MIGRLATENDLPKLVDLGREFMTEGRWGWTYSDSRAAKTFLTSILHPECDTVVVVDQAARLDEASGAQRELRDQDTRA